MGIPESQLETWSHQGAVTTSKNTHESIRTALNSYERADSIKFDVYLQGSYRNSTNIRGDSDVDVVVQLNPHFYADISALSETEKTLYQAAHSDAAYSWKDFRVDVLRALHDYYGASVVSEGNKAVKVAKGSNRLPSDVVICLHYRKYLRFHSTRDQQCVEGIAFSSVFAGVFYFRSRNKMPGLAEMNELILRDEGFHYEFAVQMFKEYVKDEYKPSKESIREVILSCYETEKKFVEESMPDGLQGLTKEMMIQYVEFVTDIVLKDLKSESATSLNHLANFV